MLACKGVASRQAGGRLEATEAVSEPRRLEVAPFGADHSQHTRANQLTCLLFLLRAPQYVLLAEAPLEPISRQWANIEYLQRLRIERAQTEQPRKAQVGPLKGSAGESCSSCLEMRAPKSGNSKS